jgi:hypothetical protein
MAGHTSTPLRQIERIDPTIANRSAGFSNAAVLSTDVDCDASNIARARAISQRRHAHRADRRLQSRPEEVLWI